VAFRNRISAFDFRHHEESESKLIDLGYVNFGGLGMRMQPG
jgi:hypothetical protein